jgi:7-cyano-7-deazaguanine synthase
MIMTKKAVLLLSGGLDSSTLVALLSNQGYEIHALSFFYNQRQSVELERIKKFITSYPAVKNHTIINIDLSSFVISSLVNKDLEVPKYSSHTDLGNKIPSTYVPARNTIFLSYALGYAETIDANKIFLGTHYDDSANYPDCRPEYLKAFEILANLATAKGVNGGGIQIIAPLLHMSKAEIVTTGLKLGVDYTNTITCYDPNDQGQSCGECHACLVRLKAFELNQIKDPISYSR